MATHIIKEGQKKFIATCSCCGCEFEYELEDIGAGNTVNCPCCEHICMHKNFETSNNRNIIYPYGPSEIPCNKDSDPDSWLKKPKITYTTQPFVKCCEDCDWYKQMQLRREPYVGDSPCDWCFNSPNKVICNADK